MNGSSTLLWPTLGSLYARFQPITEPMIRAVAGLSLAAHGYQLLFGAMAVNVAFFEKAGFDPALPLVILCGVVQFGGGLCLAAGVLTRLVCVPIIGFLLVAIGYHWQFGFYWNKLGIEYPLFWTIVVFHFLIHGGGRWSLDAAIGREI